jgi:hypothetical protein
MRSPVSERQYAMSDEHHQGAALSRDFIGRLPVAVFSIHRNFPPGFAGLASAY